MSAPSVRPFPWPSLDATTLPEVRALRDAKRWATARLRLGEVGRALGGLVEAPVDVRIGRATRLAASPAGDGWVAVAVRGVDDSAPGALVEVEPALMARVVGRVLKRPAPFIGSPSPGPGLSGALAAVLIAALRRGHASGATAMRVVGAGPAGPLEAEPSLARAESWVISLTVVIGHDAFAARVVVVPGFVSTPPAWDARALLGLGHMPLSLPIVAFAVPLPSAELATLRPGDALVPQASEGGPKPKPMSEGEPVWLSPPGSEVGIRAQLAERGRLVLTGEAESFVMGESSMDLDRNAALVSALGDIPVVVRVEIGEATMSAREWASLSRGDVIALGKRLGDLVLLRVSGVPVARGELVQLDGEVAVRIVERLDSGASP